MHDPMTQAFQINYPWKKYGKAGRNEFERNYHEPFITIWHVDPESDGTDDSCGWSRPRLSKDQQHRIESFAGYEAREPYYQRFRGKEIDSPTEAETLLRQAFLMIGRKFTKEYLCEPPIRPVTFAEASLWACEMLGNSVDNFRSSLSFPPGWSSNFEEDREQDRKYCAERFFGAIASIILRERRPWYRHPRWHVRHWKFQIHPMEQFKRYVFSRCATCHGRFAWGETGVTNTWNNTGPQWFRSESNLHHMNCGGHGIGNNKAQTGDPVAGNQS